MGPAPIATAPELDDADYEWSAFAAQQAVEKALKALILTRGGEPWGHSLTALVEALPADIEKPLEVIEAASRLDKHYIPARYPSGFASFGRTTCRPSTWPAVILSGTPPTSISKFGRR